jgi:hypothetical protein
MQSRRFPFAAALCAIVLAWAPLARSQGVFGVVEMDSWGGFSSNLAAFCQSAELPFALINLNALAGPALRAPNLAGVDLRRPIRIYLLLKSKNGKPEPAAVIGLPVSDNGTAYLDTLRGAFATAAENNGAHVFSGPRGMMLRARRAAVVVTNGVALVADAAADAAAAADALRANAVPAFGKMPADVRVGLDMAALLPLVERAADEMHDRMGKMPAPQPGMPDPGAVLDAEMEAAVSFCRQVGKLSLGFKADAAAATITASLDARPGTTLEGVLQQQRPPSERYMGLLPPDALFGVVGGGLGGMNLLAKPYAALMEKMYRGIPGMAGTAGAMRDLLMKTAGMNAGDYAVGLIRDARSARDVVFVEVVAIADPAKAGQVMREGLAMANDMYKGMPIGLSVETLPARVHAGVPVTAFRYRVTEPTNAAPGMAFPMPTAAINGFLAKLSFEYAILDKDIVVAAGRAGAIDQVIDRMRLPGGPAFGRKARALFGDISAPPTEIGHMDLTAALPVVLRLIPGVDTNALAMLPPPGDGLGTIEFRRGNSWVGALRVSASEVRALAAAVPAMQALMSPGGTPGDAEDPDAAPAAVKPAPVRRGPGPRPLPRPAPRPMPAPAPGP